MVAGSIKEDTTAIYSLKDTLAEILTESTMVPSATASLGDHFVDYDN
jgi:hypothetical protein